MTCRIDRVAIDGGVVLHVSGRLTGDDLEVLRRSLAEGRVAAIDLAEIELVDRETVTLLAHEEVNGVELRNSPGYVREWITRERTGGLS
jgi:hypothetical protein